MPELPEVESIRSVLQGQCKNRIIEESRVEDTRLLQNCTTEQLRHTVEQQTIREVDRIGKYLIFRLDRAALVNHLRMSGRWILEEDDRTRWSLTLDDGNSLYFDDLRRFGTLHLISENPVRKQPPLQKLGLEPTTNDWTLQNFHQLFKTSREIKRMLLDQKRIAGLGNIYSSEVLFRTNLHPEQPVNTISSDRIEQLFRKIPELLQHAIEHRGTSMDDQLYITPSGSPGNFQFQLQVYNREGEPCPRCDTTIERFKQGQRSSYFCPKCQSPPSS